MLWHCLDQFTSQIDFLQYVDDKTESIQIRFVLGIPPTRRSNKSKFKGAPLKQYRSDLHKSV